MIGYIKNICRRLKYRESSEVKIIQYLLRASKFFSALVENKLELFFKKMERDIPRILLKDKRFSKTMRERVSSKERYYGLQATEGQCVA